MLYNENGIATVGLDGELCRLGRRQALQLGERGVMRGVVDVSISAGQLRPPRIAFGGTSIPVRHLDARLPRV